MNQRGLFLLGFFMRGKNFDQKVAGQMYAGGTEKAMRLKGIFVFARDALFVPIDENLIFADVFYTVLVAVFVCRMVPLGRDQRGNRFSGKTGSGLTLRP